MVGGKAREASSRSRARPKTGRVDGVRVHEVAVWQKRMKADGGRLNLLNLFRQEPKKIYGTILTVNVSLSPI